MWNYGTFTRRMPTPCTLSWHAPHDNREQEELRLSIKFPLPLLRLTNKLRSLVNGGKGREMIAEGMHMASTTQFHPHKKDTKLIELSYRKDKMEIQVQGDMEV